MIFLSSAMFTTLKGVEMFSRPEINREYLLLLGGLTCLGVTERSCMLNPY